MKLILLLVFGVLFIAGIGLMVFGYRLNFRDGTKRYHPGNRWINIGLIVIILCGISLAMVAWTGFAP